MNDEFNRMPKQGIDLWGKVATKLASMFADCDKDGQACRKKWARVNKHYREDKSHNAISGNDRKRSCKWYDIVDEYMHGKANVVCKSHASSIGEEFEPGQHGQEGIYVHSQEKEEKKVSSKASAKDDALHQLVLHMKQEFSRRAAMEERRQTSFEAMQSIMASLLDQVFISYVIIDSDFNMWFLSAVLSSTELLSAEFSSGCVWFHQMTHGKLEMSCHILFNGVLYDKSHKRRHGHLTRACWSFSQPQGYLQHFFLGSWDEKMFRKHLRVSKSTFEYICSMLAPAMKRQNTRMQRAISLEDRVALSLHRLASIVNVEVLADLYGCVRSTNTQIVLDFCRAVCTSGLRDFYICSPSSSRMLQMAEAFQQIRGIPNVIGAIDGSHIPIIAPRENAVDYFNRKEFHSILLQLAVDSNCMVWDYDVGWAGSIHDSVNFSRSELGKRCENGMLNEFCLVGDCAYSARPYMLVPLRALRHGSPYMPSLVVACLVLHNICVVHKDQFKMEWIRDAEIEVQQFSCREQGRITSSVLSELQAIRPQTEDQVVARKQNDGGTNVEVEEDDNYCDKDAHHLGSKATKCDNLARVMYKEHTRWNVQLVFGSTNTIDSESDSAYDEAEEL
ncbi:hypothetical protein L7F22_022097 [Adiantum nelumboides]|nr:hypothetical protein [Adiantum nelumboides]